MLRIFLTLVAIENVRTWLRPHSPFSGASLDAVLNHDINLCVGRSATYRVESKHIDNLLVVISLLRNKPSQ